MEWKDRLLFAYDLQWFAKDGPGGEKTEPATEKKLREAREDGKVAKSKELTAAFDLIVDRKSTRLNSSHKTESRMPSSA